MLTLGKHLALATPWWSWDCSEVRKALWASVLVRLRRLVNERLKANLLAKALDLRNANAAGIAFENRRRIIKAFSMPENPYDTGRTEVQGAYILFSELGRCYL